MAHNLKSIRERFKANGVFYSDTALAELLKSLVPSDTTEVYDPTCGDGGLLAVFPDDVSKYGQELDSAQAQAASDRLVNAKIAAGDTLVTPAFIGRRFKAIVANPPFSVKWDEATADKRIFEGVPCLPPPAKADYAFLLHIGQLGINMLMPGIIGTSQYLVDGSKNGCRDNYWGNGLRIAKKSLYLHE